MLWIVGDPYSAFNLLCGSRIMPAVSLILSRILRLIWVLVGPKIYSVVDGQVLVTL